MKNVIYKADNNNDGLIDSKDVKEMRYYLKKYCNQESNEYYRMGDLNLDGTVDKNDLIALQTSVFLPDVAAAVIRDKAGAFIRQSDRSRQIIAETGHTIKIVDKEYAAVRLRRPGAASRLFLRVSRAVRSIRLPRSLRVDIP